MKSAKGFTLAETLTALVIAGILAVLTTPSLLKILNNSKAEQRIGKIESLIKQSQKDAIRRSKKCNIKISSNKIISSCNGKIDLENITFNQTEPIDFDISFKGHTSSEKASFPIIIKSGNKCLIISSPLGIIRSGLVQPDIGCRL